MRMLKKPSQCCNPKYEFFVHGQRVEETVEEMDIRVVIAANMKLCAQCTQAAQTAQGVCMVPLESSGQVLSRKGATAGSEAGVGA